MIKNCPKCNLINPPGAQHCDCGYSFTTEQIEDFLKAKHSGGRGMTEKKILLIALTIFILMGLIPPWEYSRGGFEAYSLLISPPSNSCSIAIGHLFVQWFMLAVITGVLIYLKRKE